MKKHSAEVIARDRIIEAAFTVMCEWYGYTEKRQLLLFANNWVEGVSFFSRINERLGGRAALLHWIMHEIGHVVVGRRSTERAPKGWTYRQIDKDDYELSPVEDPLLELKVRALEANVIQLFSIGIPGLVKELGRPTSTHRSKQGLHEYGNCMPVVRQICHQDLDVVDWSWPIFDRIMRVALVCDGEIVQEWIDHLDTEGARLNDERKARRKKGDRR